MKIKEIESSHVRQLDQRDCGVACLLSLIRFYGGDSNFEQIRRISGTDLQGTTLLGLKEAATQSGFEAEGYQADIAALIEHGKPVILHVEIDKNQHYVVWYGVQIDSPPFRGGAGGGVKTAEVQHLIGDPAHGVQSWTNEKLQTHWKSANCLILEPTENFAKIKSKNAEQWHWFVDLLRPSVPLLLIAAILGVLVAVLGLAMAIYSQQLIDKILPSKNPDRIILSVVLLLVLLFARVGLSFLRQFLLLRQSKEFGVAINTAFYDKLLHLPKSFFDTRKIGDFVARLNDTTRIQRTVSNLSGNLLVDLFLVFASFGLLFYYGWQIGVMSLLVLPLYFWLIYRQNKQIIEAQKNVMVAYSQSESNYINTIQGIADLKNRNKQSHFANLNQLLYGYFQECTYQQSIIQTRLSASAGIASVLFIALVLGFTLHAVYIGTMKIGEMTAILGAVSSLLPAVANLALVSVPLNEAKIAFDRMYEFTSTIPEKANENAENVVFQSLKANNICFRFTGKTQVLKNINFELNKGEIIAIVGESGGGKSLICQLIQQFYQPESGHFLLNQGLPLQEIDVQNWRKLIGIVPQQVHIFNGTVIENICFGDSQQEIQHGFQLLEDYGFSPFLDSFPQGILTILGEDGVNLSGGQRQIIGLARALVAQPSLLILDEATAALDRHTEQFILKLLLRLKSEMGILFITHRLHTLRQICDRIYILENGTFTQNGKHEELMKNENVYSRYWHEF